MYMLSALKVVLKITITKATKIVPMNFFSIALRDRQSGLQAGKWQK